jgi:hypothetical protein
MSGVGLIWYKLSQAAAVIAVVPAVRIIAGVLPQGTVLPAISLTEITGVEKLNLAASSGLHTDRVQVTVEAATYPQVQQILALCRTALPYTRGTVNNIKCDSLLPDVRGPDGFDDLLKCHFKSQDFIVKWSE